MSVRGRQKFPESLLSSREFPDEATETLISVVVPSHNDAAHIEQCIDSVLGQNVQPDEIIICDDASTDATRSVISRLKRRFPDRIRALYHDANIGCAENFNSGIIAAKGRYLSLIAADDYWRPDKLEKELSQLRQTGRRWAYSAVELIWDDGPHAGKTVPFWGTEAGHAGDLFEDILLRNISPRNFLIERRLLIELGGFNEDFGMYEDWDLKLRLAERYPAAFVSDVGITYRQHDKGISRSDSDRQLAEAAKVLRKNAGLIAKRFPQRLKALRDAAWEKLLPGSEQIVLEKSGWLDLDYVPRCLDQRGRGMVFVVGSLQLQLVNGLVHHPDTACVTKDGTLNEIWDLAPSKAAIDDGRLEWMGAALYTAYRRLLRQSGRSRIVDAVSAKPENVATVLRIFPDAMFVLSNHTAETSGISDINPQANVFVIDAAVADDQLTRCFHQLCLDLDLPVEPVYNDLPVEGAASPDSATVLLAEGEQLFTAGETDAAEQRFYQALEIDASIPELYNNLGVVCWQKNDAAGALQFLSKGLALDARHPDLLMNTIQVLLTLQHFDEAEMLYKQYVEVNPSALEMRDLMEAARQASTRAMP